MTSLLQAWGRGDPGARERLVPLVYAELRRRAAAYLRRERPDHTLQPTALVHEAYLKLVGQERVDWQNRAHFFAVSAQLMRRILVDHAKGRRRKKRSGASMRVEFDGRAGAVAAPEYDLLAIDQALDELTAIDPRQARVVELLFYAGLSESEVAQVLAVSRATVTREWQIAKGWLYRRVTGRRPRGRL